MIYQKLEKLSASYIKSTDLVFQNQNINLKILLDTLLKEHPEPSWRSYRFPARFRIFYLTQEERMDFPDV